MKLIMEEKIINKKVKLDFEILVEEQPFPV